jgi:hypothetical protein
MAVVDSRGRVLGRVNLVDALLLLVLVGLVPLAYGAYALFRTPLPALTGVEPPVVAEETSIRLTLRGEHFRPYHRVSFSGHQGRTFEFKSVSEASVEVVSLPPGTYDVVLYDHAQERSRLPGALTVMASPIPPREVLVVGRLGNLTAVEAQAVSVSPRIEGGELVRVGAVQPGMVRLGTGVASVDIPTPDGLQVPVVARLACEVHAPEGRADCRVGGIALFAGRTISVMTPHGPRPLQVDQVTGLEPWETLHLRLAVTADPRLVELVAVGDRSHLLAVNELAAAFTVTRVLTRGPAQREVEVEVPAQWTSTGWHVAGVAVRAGGDFPLGTTTYQLGGTVIEVRPREGRSGSHLPLP